MFAGYFPPLTLYAEHLESGVARCGAPECPGRLEQLNWNADGSEVTFARLEGNNYLSRGFYAWTPGSQSVRTILQTDEWIEQCEPSGDMLICLYEDVTDPRRIVRLNPKDGAIETVFDPNPEFKALEFTQIEKLEWREPSGEWAAGHLVYPAGYERGKRYPIVIVQYRSKRFLWGGVGQEYPIHPLAAEGFFVLSFERPEKRDLYQRKSDPWEVERHYWGEDLWEKTSAVAALDIALDDLERRGLIDPGRIGITGLSDGSENLWYAMIHSDRYAAAVTATGGWSPTWFFLMNQGARQNYLRKAAGLSAPGDEAADARWRRISPDLNADKINTPILLQVADHELIPSVPSIAALQDAGKPIEAYVFPNEYHIKWQPKHKLAVYNQTIDWFNFWLRDAQDPDPEKAAQYERWRELRKQRDEKASQRN